MRYRLFPRKLATAMLLASTALTYGALAQTATPAATPDATTPAQSAPAAGQGGSFGSSQPTDIGRIKSTGGEATSTGVTRVDIGGGYMIQEDQAKSRSTVTRDAIAKLSPTSNPYQLIESLPGANVTSTDAFGLNGGNITVRGFNSDQLGLTIDGAPVNDSGNYALYPQEYLDAENIGQVSLAQGFTDLDSPHIGATGGVINIYSIDPPKKAGGFVDFSYGSNHTTREFIRLETGQIGRARGYFSYSHYENDHWRGPGGDVRDHFDAKVVIDVREASKITISALYNHELNNFYANPTQANFNAFGPYAPQNNEDTVYNPGGTTLKQNTGTNGYYKLRINPFDNLVLSAPSTFALRDNLTLDVTPYFWYGYGSGGGYSSVSESGFNYGGQRITQDLNGNGTTTDKINLYTPSITRTYRPGIISKLNYQLDNNKLTLGYMYEAAYHHQYGTASLVNPDGTPQDAFAEVNNIVIKSGAYAGKLLEKRNTVTNTRTNIIFGGDEISLLGDKLVLDIGVKQAFVSRHGDNELPSGPYATITPYRNLTDTETLPVLGVSYKPNPQNQFFAGLATSFRTPQNFSLFDSVSLTSTAANNGFVVGGKQKPERAIQIEAGHRYQGDVLTTAVSVFGYHYQSRQFQTNIPDPAGGNVFISQNINAGNTTTYGIDAEVGTRPINNFRPYVSAEYLHATLDGDIQTSSSLNGKTINDYLPTRGKYVPNAPQFSAAVGVDYDDGHLFGNLNIKYTGMQYSSFTNDESVGSYGRVNMGIGYRFDDFSYAKKPEIRLNLYNIADQTVLTGVNSVSSTAKNITGRNGGTISGSAPSYYVGQGFAALVTLSSAF